MSTSALCISLLFSLFLFHGVGDVEASRRLYTNDRSRHFKLHYTLMNGVVSNNSESTPPLMKSPPPLKDSTPPPPLLNVTDTVGLVVTSGNQSQPPSELVPAESGGSPSGLSHVVVIALLSFALIALTGLGIWFICFKGRRHESANNVPNSKSNGSATTTNGHTASTPSSTYSSVPPSTTNERESDGSVPAQKSAASIVKGQRNGGPVRTHPSAPPPKANVQGGDRSVPAQPSAAPPMVKARGHGGSVPTPPAPAVAHERRDGETTYYSSYGNCFAYLFPDVTHNASSHPAPMKNPPSTQLASRHTPTATSVSEIRKPNRRPSRVAEFGLTAFTYEELRDATDNFSQANFLGEGGFAKVYKGSLYKNMKVAVKLLKNENSKAEREFRNEVDIISRLRHKNIVTLIGYCITESRRMIVYEFIENRSLHDHLRGGKDLKLMDWAIRMKIAQGAAKGLAYLHVECGHQNIIHRDVKPANILLDSSFEAKVADFGIAKLCPISFDSYTATYVIGSVGFIDPFYYETKELSCKSDVYSFGVVLLELISGEIDLPTVQKLKKKLPRALKHGNFDAIADPKLKKNYNLDEMTLMVTCIEACLRKDPKDRPPMSQVVRVLEKDIPANF